MNQNRKYIKAEKRVAIVVLCFSLVGALAFTLWAGPVLATWAITGQWVRLSYGRALIVTIGAAFSVAHATRRWPPLVRQAATLHLRWWLAIALLLASEVSVATGVLRWLDRIASQPVADRRWWHLKGISPRTYGRTHTLAPLLVKRREPDQIVVGIHQGRRLAVQKNVHMLVIAPPRSGKTAGIIIPALLDHTGPVISTSVRTDVRNRTVTRRRELGDVFQWDPFTLSGDTDFYDPIHGCKDWGHALRVARWFTGAVSLSTGGSQDYFNEEAESLLAPLIYAAAWQPNGSIVSVFDWLERKDPNDATSLLDQVGRAHPNQPHVQRACAAAIAKLEGTFAYNERQLDGLIGTARVFLKVYGNPAARATAETWRAKDAGRRIITPEAVFGKRRGGVEPANTLYLIADRDDQKQLAPIIVMMLSEMVYYLDQQYNRRRELPLSAMFALDEAAQIAPLQDINRIMSASLPNSRFITVWHSGLADTGPLRRRNRPRDPRGVPGEDLPRVKHRRRNRQRGQPDRRPARRRSDVQPRDSDRSGTPAPRRGTGDPRAHPIPARPVQAAPLLQGSDAAADGRQPRPRRGGSCTRGDRGGGVMRPSFLSPCEKRDYLEPGPSPLLPLSCLLALAAAVVVVAAELGGRLALITAAFTAVTLATRLPRVLPVTAALALLIAAIAVLAGPGTAAVIAAHTLTHTTTRR